MSVSLAFRCCWFLIATLGARGSEQSGCLVGDIEYQHNDNIGYIGYACTGSATFNGTESFCRDGTVVEEFYEGECSGGASFCVQQGSGWGAALCLSEPAPQEPRPEMGSSGPEMGSSECDKLVGPEKEICLAARMGSVTATVANPTGDCEADSDGSRRGYHSVQPGTAYLPDCACPLLREYWRVFAMDETDAYVIPRPDGMGLKYGYCDGEDSELAALFNSNDLCSEILTDLSRINHMKPADALRITHALHERLVFEARTTSGQWGEMTSGQWEISPWAPEDDLLATCDGKLTENVDAQAHCQALRSRCNVAATACNDMLIIPNENAVKAFVPALNELYGIKHSSTSIDDTSSGALRLVVWWSLCLSLGIAM